MVGGAVVRRFFKETVTRQTNSLTSSAESSLTSSNSKQSHVSDGCTGDMTQMRLEWAATEMPRL